MGKGRYRYEETAESLIEEFDKLIALDENWQFYREHEDIKIYKRYVDWNKCVALIGQADVHMPADKLIDFIHPFSHYKFQFDPHAVFTECLEELSPTTCVAHQCVRPKILGIPFAGDSVDIMSFDDKSESYYHCAFKSISYDKPMHKTYGIRGWVYPSGLAAYKTSNPDVTRIRIMWQAKYKVPFKMLIPLETSLAATSIVHYIEALNKMCDVPYRPLGPDQPLCRFRRKNSEG